MLKTTREKQVEKMIHAGLTNLYKSQSELDFDEFAIVTLEGLMLLEREEYLKSHIGSKDAGNGSYLRNFKSLRTNSLSISIPRSRNGQFKPVLLDLINQQKEQVGDLSLLLYRKGLSTRDISDVMEEFFGESISRETINNLAENFNEIRTNWENRKLDAYYKVVYCDALYISLRRGNSYSKEAVYVMYGIKDDNSRELLLLEVNPTEGCTMWGEYFSKLKSKGVEQIDLIVSDGVVGFADVARKYYPEGDVQRCVVHLQRNLLTKIRPRDKESFAYDIKIAFNNFDNGSRKEDALKKLERVYEKWKDSYRGILEKLKDEEFIVDYLTYIDYPVEVRRMIYTTNSIENLNRQIRKVTKTKVTFDKESNMLDLIFVVIKDFEANNWQKYPVHAFQSWPKNTQSL
jgi:transposase-like protein